MRNSQTAKWIKRVSLGAIMMGVVAMLFSSLTAQESLSGKGVILSLNGPVTPANGNYIVREIETANAAGADLIIMEVDTPGGLMDSMKDIIKSMLASDAPVVTWVGPQGARSASAGLYIMYAAQVSAMAPATNTGSATPIQMGGGGDDQGPRERGLEEILERLNQMEKTEEAPAEEGTEEEAAEAAPVSEEAPVEDAQEPVDTSNEASLRGKIIEDSVAYIRGLAQLRGRNAEWAEKAVRPPSASVTAEEALALGVIEIVATDIDDLLGQLDGRTVQTAKGEVVIDTENMQLARVEPQAWEKILAFFANPNVAAILISLGTLGLTVELWNPGSIFPGVFGAVCLALGLYALQVLPHDAVFLIVIALGALLLIMEAFTPSFGIIGLAGLLLLATGLWFLFPEEMKVSESLLAGIIIIGGGFLAIVLTAITRSYGHGPLIGAEAIRKRTGRVEEWDVTKGKGRVLVEGEYWQARSKEPLKPGDSVTVMDVDGIILVVKSASGGGRMLNRMLGAKVAPGSNRTTPPKAT